MEFHGDVEMIEDSGGTASKEQGIVEIRRKAALRSAQEARASAELKRNQAGQEVSEVEMQKRRDQAARDRGAAAAKRAEAASGQQPWMRGQPPAAGKGKKGRGKKMPARLWRGAGRG